MYRRPRRNHSPAFKAKVALVAALGLSRGSVYYVPRPVRAADLALMRRLDALHLDFPFAGARMLRRLLRRTDGRRTAARDDAHSPHADHGARAAARHK